jgi:hypothetical protein
MPNLVRTSLSVKELTDKYAKGEIAIPEIQRDFVWDAARIKLLLDSIQKDYPSGAIILWRPEFRTRSEFEMLIRPERLHLYKDNLPTYLLLDGQQRLTALCSVILPATQVMDSLGEEIDLPKLFINMKTLAIEARKDSVSLSNNEVLLNQLLSAETEDSGLSSIWNDIAARNDITAKQREGLKGFRERVLLYSYPVQILENHDYETVANIFKRVNSQGKILVTAELELATIVPHWKGFSKHLRTFIKEMRGVGFNADLPFYMKCLAFIATDWPAIDFFSRKVVKGDEYSTKQLEQYWELTKKSVRKLHAVLKKHKIDRTELITTRNALVPIVYAIAKDKKNKISDGILIKWLIYSMAGGHYTRQTESVLRRDSYFLTGTSPIEDGFAKLYRQMIRKDLYSTTFDKKYDFDGVSSKNPAMLFMYLSLGHYSAIDFNGKKALPIEKLAKYEIHHIFPMEYMLGDDEEAEKYKKQQKLSKAEYKERINNVANLTFISPEKNKEIGKRPPYDYLPKMTTPESRAAHCIPDNPDLWHPSKFEEFCKERRRLLAKAMNSYIWNLE